MIFGYTLNFYYIIIKSYVMGLISKVRKKENDKEFSKQEVEFMLAKLRSATYRGDEFEMFYNVWVKLTDNLDKIKDTK